MILENFAVPKYSNIHRKTPVLESLFDKVAGLSEIAKFYFEEHLRRRTSTKGCFLMTFELFLEKAFMTRLGNQVVFAVATYN